MADTPKVVTIELLSRVKGSKLEPQVVGTFDIPLEVVPTEVTQPLPVPPLPSPEAKPKDV